MPVAEIRALHDAAVQLAGPGPHDPDASQAERGDPQLPFAPGPPLCALCASASSSPRTTSAVVSARPAGRSRPARPPASTRTRKAPPHDQPCPIPRSDHRHRGLPASRLRRARRALREPSQARPAVPLWCEQPHQGRMYLRKDQHDGGRSLPILAVCRRRSRRGSTSLAPDSVALSAAPCRP